MYVARLVALGAVACLLWTACGQEGSGSAAPTPAPTAEPSAPAPTPTPSTPEPAPTAAAADPCAPPEGGLRGDAAAGAAVYQQYCNLCHGPDAAPMEPKPADHKDCAYMGTLTDEHIYRAVCGGGTAVGKSAVMPAWRGIIPTEDIRGLIGHLRSLCPA